MDIFIVGNVSEIASGCVRKGGQPKRMRCNNVPKYTSSLLATWAINKGIELMFIQLGNPQQNAYVGRYKRTVRYDWSNHYLFDSIEDVQNRAAQ
jgi:putative transposase